MSTSTTATQSNRHRQPETKVETTGHSNAASYSQQHSNPRRSSTSVQENLSDHQSRTSYQQPYFQQSPYQQQSHQQPSYQQPSYQQPSYQQPSYQQPSYQQSPYQQPSYQQPQPTRNVAQAKTETTRHSKAASYSQQRSDPRHSNTSIKDDKPDYQRRTSYQQPSDQQYPSTNSVAHRPRSESNIDEPYDRHSRQSQIEEEDSQHQDLRNYRHSRLSNVHRGGTTETQKSRAPVVTPRESDGGDSKATAPGRHEKVGAKRSQVTPARSKKDDTSRHQTRAYTFPQDGSEDHRKERHQNYSDDDGVSPQRAKPKPPVPPNTGPESPPAQRPKKPDPKPDPTPDPRPNPKPEPVKDPRFNPRPAKPSEQTRYECPRRDPDDDPSLDGGRGQAPFASGNDLRQPLRDDEGGRTKANEGRKTATDQGCRPRLGNERETKVEVERMTRAEEGRKPKVDGGRKAQVQYKRAPKVDNTLRQYP